MLETSESGDDAPEWTVVEESISPARGTLLPDLDQQAPSGILVLRMGTRMKLGFTSAVDNVGDGPIHIRGTRLGAARTMRADQLIHRRDGTFRVVSEIGRLAYEPHPPHFHWHLEPYESYELRRSVRQRTRRSRPQERVLPARPLGTRSAAAGHRRRAAEVRRQLRGAATGGTTGRRGVVGRVTPTAIPGFFHGQDIDITGLEPGLYVLVHRANPERRIRELRYSNNAASALIRISAGERFHGRSDGDDRSTLPRDRRMPGTLRR